MAYTGRIIRRKPRHTLHRSLTGSQTRAWRQLRLLHIST